MKSQTKTPSSSKIDLTWAVEKQTVWIMLSEDDSSGEACSKGVIVKMIDDESAQIQIEGSNEVAIIKGDKIFPLNNYKDYPKGYDDMVQMEYLSEAELLNNLRIRFQSDMIYTYVGPTLVVINPYKKVEELLHPRVLQKFHASLLHGRFEQKDHMPHVYAIAATTMRNMFENNKNQAIVISGESGAGKTENTKSAMKFLTSLGKHEESSTNIKEENIEDKILACNPVLEAFGNAKTVRNDNSSRFGKYVALLVEKDSKKIIGATITNYLLEKSRVVGQNSDERNYHIFYAFLRGAPEDTLKKFFLTRNTGDWAFLRNSFQDEVKTVPDAELYREVIDSFNTMHFSESEQNAIWTYTAASLLIGNIDFDESEFSDTTPCKVNNEEYLKNVAKLLDVDYDRFSKSLRYRTRVVGTSTIDSTLKRDECLIFRDSLAKDLFNKLFNWLVRRLNFTVMPPEFTKGGLNMVALLQKYYHIGLLDIFGFEIFKFNSIEQFCINFSNEKLQQLYISYVFKGEQKEFIDEGLKDFLCELTFKDNQGLIDMLDSMKLPGIFQMIDESCSVNATDQILYDKIVKQFKKPDFPFTTPKLARDTFIVKHTAKEVEYNINGFRAKNKDEISKTIEDAICSSRITEIVRVWKNLCLEEVESEEAKNAKPNPKDKFLGYKFRVQMKELMEELNSCECHFIRCIKPNESKKPDFFLPQLVLQQIKYMGILDTIKVRKDSFPIRTPYKSFYERFQELAPQDSKISFDEHMKNGSDFTAMAKRICQNKVPGLINKAILYGNNKIFMRVEAIKEIEKLKRDLEEKKTKAIKKFQNACIRYRKMNIFRDMLKGIKTIQETFRAKKEYLKFCMLRRKVTQIQKWWKLILEKRRIERFRKVVFGIQRFWKMKVYKKRYNKLKAATQMINRCMRGAICRKKLKVHKYCKAIIEDIIHKGALIMFEKVKDVAAMTLQKYFRGFLCRRELKEEMQRIKKAKEDFAKNKVITTIQKCAKGFIVRSILKRQHKAAQFIQGYMKMRWLSSLFQKLRIVSIIIQRAVRRWSIRRKIIKERMEKFMFTEGSLYKSQQVAEQTNFFGASILMKNQKANDSCSPKLSLIKTKETSFYGNDSCINTTTIVPVNTLDHSITCDTLKGHHSIEANPQETQFHSIDSTRNFIDQSSILNSTKEVDPFSSKKINLYTKVIDFDLLSDPSLFYDPLWSTQILQLQKECNTNDSDIQLIEVGQAHTAVLPNNGRAYSFGWNDRFQLGRSDQSRESISFCKQISLPTENFRPKSISVGDDHNLLIDYQSNLYIWGDNSQGQLGLGHSKEVSRIAILDFLTDDSVKEIKAKAKNSLVVTQNGKVFYWPLQIKSGENIFKPAELFLPPKIQIATAACGYNFAVLLSRNGYVFTFGSDNQAGQLGQGDTVPRETPALVENLKMANEIIVSVSCGYKHVICKSKLGKVFTWGWGEKGQLGHGGLENEFKPKILNFAQNTGKLKALQVQAGFKHSVIILEDFKILWFGTNGSIECQDSPTEVILYKKIPNLPKDLTPIKVLCTWSKTMSITYAVLGDVRALKLNPKQTRNIFSTLASKMEENQSLNDADLPYVESIAKYFSVRNMKDRSCGEVKTDRLSPSKKTLNGSPTSPSKIINKEFVGPRFCNALSKMRSSPNNRETVQTQKMNLSCHKTLNSSGSTKNIRKIASSFVSADISQLISPINTLSPVLKVNECKKEKSLELLDELFSPILKSKRIDESPENKSQSDNHLEALNQKLIRIKKKMQKIKEAPIESWSKTDIEFLKIATEPHMLELLKNIKT